MTAVSALLRGRLSDSSTLGRGKRDQIPLQKVHLTRGLADASRKIERPRGRSAVFQRLCAESPDIASGSTAGSSGRLLRAPSWPASPSEAPTRLDMRSGGRAPR